MSARELLCGFLLPSLSLPSHLVHLDHTGLCRNPPERCTRFDGLKLFGIADEDDLGSGLLDRIEHAGELSCADQPRLINHQYISSCELVVALLPAQFPARECPRTDAARGLQVLSSDARERCSLNR